MAVCVTQQRHTLVQAVEAGVAASEEAARTAGEQLDESQRALSKRAAAWEAERAALLQHQAHAAVRWCSAAAGLPATCLQCSVTGGRGCVSPVWAPSGSLWVMEHEVIGL